MERLRDQPYRPERVTASQAKVAGLGEHARLLAELAEAEQAEGWLARCVEDGCYLALSAQFVDALAATLRSLGGAPVLEVCAGDGSLAAALRDRGLEVTATDAHPPVAAGSPVERLAADEALRRHPAEVVLGSFVPVDAGVDGRVLESPHVRHYLVLNARLGGELGASCLWTRPGWTRTPLREVARWMICRHDVWLGHGVPVLSHGEAWLLSRTEPDGPRDA